MTYIVEHNACLGGGCTATYVTHKWGTMQATREGWFLQRNGDAWCPRHIPDWVVEWRAKKAERKS